ncbi:MAG: DUF58 domain-containing protein [Chloroflexota bacterium]|nr:DUF58 domain-containing protein [Chloroflexota bacterium]
MFRDRWVVVVLITTVLGFATGQGALLFMAALVATIVPVSQLWNRWSLRNLVYTRTFDESRVFVGETIGVTLELANEKVLPLFWVQVDDRFPQTMPPNERELLPSGIAETGVLSHVAALLWYERVRWRYHITCNQRGFYFFGPLRLRSGDIFGLRESETTLEGTTRLIVYPQVQPLERLGLPAKDPFGGKRVNLPVFEDPIRVVGARDYHPDDPMRRVHWKASARMQSLQVRVWEPAQEPQWVVFLNVATFRRHWQGVNRRLLERTISVAASICQHAFDDRYAVGLVANASVPKSDQPVKVSPGRSPHQMRYILEALAAVTSFATSSIDQLLHLESPKAGWGATLVVVTSVVTEELKEQMVRLHRVGRKVALLSLDKNFTEEDGTDLALQGVVVHRLPQEEHDPHASWKPKPQPILGGVAR